MALPFPHLIELELLIPFQIQLEMNSPHFLIHRLLDLSLYLALLLSHFWNFFSLNRCCRRPGRGGLTSTSADELASGTSGPWHLQAEKIDYKEFKRSNKIELI